MYGENRNMCKGESSRRHYFMLSVQARAETNGLFEETLRQEEKDLV